MKHPFLELFKKFIDLLKCYREISKLSPEYYIFVIKSLTALYHYFLYESTSDSKVFSNHIAEIGILQSFSGQLISGLSNAFNFQATNKVCFLMSLFVVCILFLVSS